MKKPAGRIYGNLSRSQVVMLVAAVSMGLVHCARAGTVGAPAGQAAAPRPASSAGSHARVAKQKIGEEGKAAWIFTPDSPRPSAAPVVVFLHGYRAVNPYAYGGWIDHLVRRGNIVVFPIFEESPRDETDQIVRNAVTGIRQALNQLQKTGPVRPDLARVAFVGHSFGGGMSAQLAAMAQREGLPVPKAILMAQPGWRGSEGYPAGPLSEIPASVLMLVIDGSEDQFAKTRHGEDILSGARQVPATRKAHLVLEPGAPGMLADHYAPLAPHADYQLEQKTGRAARRERLVKRVMDIREGEEDALDRQGFWRFGDALMEAGFRGESSIAGVVGLANGKAGDTATIRVPIRPNGS
ncbi:hypothetical protein SVA_2009 [Sulfurifustis variabilis]|uniref:Alpha/beta hydrolase n=1 Tax=Sulfurifustis variabilis TaxID=1675686 RepID=A0A1B4VC04_9GAMM|nr:alpha/beta hydrolase [Sulfurifustis variabilis]BAU48561.1 hypothetical protein SVA_2009 [Sulfurifustis variabilis]